MTNILDNYNYSESQKVKIFSVLTHYDNKIKSNVSDFSVTNIVDELKEDQIEITDQNIFDIVDKYNDEEQFTNLYLYLN
ncbi:hypothetical protein BU065_06465 [Staphylococcus succinus]|uniref:hypothetical protein n=1 Tax=Staphylococcus succinus TaxID=61015 RepID=UPI000D66A0E0|nr:hypothetical protein [Staphylococcus succinus]PWG68012.1 hypothetical protein DEM28_25625 [Enterobacter mori]MEB8127716.1 hypothetical protein [Staphylococcus succinus]MEB8210554.1 hypothetical protein [Staphylococcus succinus]RIN32379.1 hypothetical protein BU063_04350 [Staphylococcus succinus]RIN34979.1 hypothetical protein BU065_06465 [Staphylococcus succinus]